MTRRPAPLDSLYAARADAAVRGPILSVLQCGCCVDETGGVWSPCADIAPIHRNAVELAREGIRRGVLTRDHHGREVWEPTALDADQARIAAHVAAGERAAHGVDGEQGALP